MAIERRVGVLMHEMACLRLTRWANDPRITPELLRPALEAAIADYATTGPLSDNIKVEYLVFLTTYDKPELVWQCLNDANTIAPSKPAWFARETHLFQLSKGFKHEPERSRRVARLVFANLLATCDLPPGRRPPVACSLPHPDTPRTKDDHAGRPLLAGGYGTGLGQGPPARENPPMVQHDPHRQPTHAAVFLPHQGHRSRAGHAGQPGDHPGQPALRDRTWPAPRDGRGPGRTLPQSPPRSLPTSEERPPAMTTGLDTQARPRRLGRLALALAALALSGSTAFLTWWTTTLMGLPDVGDPFDVDRLHRLAGPRRPECVRPVQAGG